MLSYVEQRNTLNFPEFLGERIYMKEFYKEGGLPPEYSRWQSTVDSMLEGVDTDGPIYLMVDQGFVKANTPQRRPGLHIDGYWIPNLNAHGGHIRGGHSSGRHSGGHRSIKAGWSTGPNWIHASEEWEPEAIILASSVSASRAMSGNWYDLVGEGGDCSHIDTSGLEEIILKQNTVYAGNVTMLHESLPVKTDCYRTLVRLNIPGWTPEK